MARERPDILFGIGGTPEGVIAACALKCLGGAILGRLWPRDDDDRIAALDAGYDLDHVLTTDELVSGDDVFFSATGITNGDLLRGVRYWGDGARTESLVMRSKSGTIRTIESTHRWHEADALRGVQVRLSHASLCAGYLRRRVSPRAAQSTPPTTSCGSRTSSTPRPS